MGEEAPGPLFRFFFPSVSSFLSFPIHTAFVRARLFIKSPGTEELWCRQLKPATAVYPEMSLVNILALGFCKIQSDTGDRGSTVVKVLCCK